MKRLAAIGLLVIGALGLTSTGRYATAAQTHPAIVVAVAANFSDTAHRLGERFTAHSRCNVKFVRGSTGLLYGQIIRGAPFDIFMAADTIRPMALVTSNRVAPNQLIHYATGRLAYWDRDHTYGDLPHKPASLAKHLRDIGFPPLAIANPNTAPYGAASIAILARGGIAESEQPLIRGSNVLQAYAYVSAGHTRHGFVALSSLLAEAIDPHQYVVLESNDTSLRQSAVLLTSQSTKPRASALSGRHLTAAAFMTYLHSDEAQAIIRNAGYTVPQTSEGTENSVTNAVISLANNASQHNSSRSQSWISPHSC